ncbi:MAG: class I SAM-dependent methyltransferase [Pseudolabrys sp.]|nr:class I SAM-dependent methyltransferase [Pseudolabrys sp.]
MSETRNADQATIDGFGREWGMFTQSPPAFSEADRRAMFDAYFGIFPWETLPAGSVGADIGCGSGRWAVLVAPRVGELHVIDPSPLALAVARANLANAENVRFHAASVSALPFPDASLDFAYALGVLHHVPDTAKAICDIAAKLKSGAPFLLYLYYAFDNRSPVYRWLWKISEIGRFLLSRAPFAVQRIATYLIALFVYWPLARLAALLERIGSLPRSWPLAYYRQRAFYVMRTDAFDRFCTRLERRFTQTEIASMLRAAGFADIVFSDKAPFWVACATKR